MSHEHVAAGLSAALRAGALTADAVALQARKFAETDDRPPTTDQPVQPTGNVISLTPRRLTQLPTDTRPLPTVTAYDQLLRLHTDLRQKGPGYGPPPRTHRASRRRGDRLRHGGLLRRSNFHRRVWRPAPDGNPRNIPPVIPGMYFHDLRHSHKTWLIEDGVPEVAQAKRLGHRIPGVRGIYSHVSAVVEQRLVDGLQTRWEQTCSPTSQ